MLSDPQRSQCPSTHNRSKFTPVFAGRVTHGSGSPRDSHKRHFRTSRESYMQISDLYFGLGDPIGEDGNSPTSWNKIEKLQVVGCCPTLNDLNVLQPSTGQSSLLHEPRNTSRFCTAQFDRVGADFDNRCRHLLAAADSTSHFLTEYIKPR